MGGVGNCCGELINCASYSIGPERRGDGGGGDNGGGGSALFDVTVVGRDGARAVFEFRLERQEWGLKKGSWQTKSLLRAEVA